MKISPIKNKSKWEFVTSSTGGIGVEFLSAEGGKIYMNDPAGSLKTFAYGVVGVGLSAGFKLPKIGKLNIPIRGRSVTGTVAPAAFPNTGQLYVLDSFDGDELGFDDICGVCGLVEVSGGLIGGGSATAMLLGMDTKWAAGCIAAGPLASYCYLRLLQSATSLLLMAGVNAGVQAGGGIIGCTGYLG